jgi:hypothetical protein
LKLPDFYISRELNNLRQRMGIAPNVYGRLEVVVDPGRLSPLELEKLASREGLEIASLDEIRVLADGTLAFKNNRILVYIRDHTIHGNRPVDPKYHVANCDTLKEMKRTQRFARYVVAVRLDGTFRINLIEGTRSKTELRKLSVCQNCLNLLKFDGFEMGAPKSTRMKKVQSFTLERYFLKYSQTFHSTIPTKDSDTAPLNDYAQDFSERSNALRAAANWTCQNVRCGVKLNKHEHRKYLHVHHINGVKSDDAPHNHRILCIECHAKEPSHGHLTKLPDHQRYLALKRTLRL